MGDIPIINSLFKTEATKDSTSLDDTQSEISADEPNKTAREILEANDALTLDQKQALIRELYAKEISKLHEENSRSILNSDEEISELRRQQMHGRFRILKKSIPRGVGKNFKSI